MITEFTGENEFLSNFYPSVVLGIGGFAYSTVEHAYQAAKSEQYDDWREMHQCPTPGGAKKLGRRLAMRPHWDQLKVTVMWQALRWKFGSDYNPQLWDKLDATGEQFLQEGNRWGDRFWGVDLDTGVGSNMLGQLLMIIRSENRLKLQYDAHLN